MSDQSSQKDRVGFSDHPRHRAGPDEGYRAPRSTEPGNPPQQSIFDGAGNEIVVVTTTDDDGNVKQGTGASAEEATKDARSTKDPIGKGFGTSAGH